MEWPGALPAPMQANIASVIGAHRGDAITGQPFKRRSLVAKGAGPMTGHRHLIAGAYALPVTREDRSLRYRPGDRWSIQSCGPVLAMTCFCRVIWVMAHGKPSCVGW
jgi:hypothetical protein